MNGFLPFSNEIKVDLSQFGELAIVKQGLDDKRKHQDV